MIPASRLVTGFSEAFSSTLAPSRYSWLTRPFSQMLQVSWMLSSSRRFIGLSSLLQNVRIRVLATKSNILETGMN